MVMEVGYGVTSLVSSVQEGLPDMEQVGLICQLPGNVH